MMRTEDDLRATLYTLERHAPDAGDVLRAVHNRSVRPGPSRQPRLMRAGPVAAAAAAAAAAVVAAVSVASSGGTATGHRPPAAGSSPAAATLRARLLAAIDTARGDILFARTPSAGRSSGTWEFPWYPRPGQKVRIHVLGPHDGHGVPGKDAEYIFTMPGTRHVASASANPIDWGVQTIPGTIIVVDHDRRTWAERHHLNITIGIPLSAAQIRAQIASGQMHVIARTTLDGHKAIELGMTLSTAKGAGLRVTSALLWVNAKNYLPMRQLLKFSDGKQAVTDYSFLPPTSANLRILRPRILPSYHRTSLLPGQRPKY